MNTWIYPVEGGWAMIDTGYENSYASVVKKLHNLLIQPEEIRFHEARNQVLKAIGQTGNLVPECREETIGKGNHEFLLCTDGFWEYITEEEMTQTLADSSSPKQWLHSMRSIAAKRMKDGNDNHTAIAVFLKNI